MALHIKCRLIRELIQKKKSHSKMIYAYASIGFVVISLAYIDSATIAAHALSIPDQNAGPQSLTILNDKDEDIDIIPFAGMATKKPPAPPGPPT